MRNHYITLQQLNHKNNNLILEDILSPSDMEHVLVVERLFLHSIKSLFPQPIMYLLYVLFIIVTSSILNHSMKVLNSNLQ